MKLLLSYFLIFSFYSTIAQKIPTDYFKVPLKIPLALSGTFGELRSNHFHSGIDIRTQGKVGHKIYASAKGYVSRIKISHYGYGKALYIQHPNGYTTVYAHLKKFAPKIEAYIKKKQYEKESYTIELFPDATTLKVSQDEIIAYSGNSGGSGGPHLHFEIRDNQQRPMNPLLFGIEVPDTRKPLVNSVWLYPLDSDSHINNTHKPYRLKITALNSGNLKASPVKACGNIGIALSTVDQQNYSNNKNGYYKIKSVVNGNPSFALEMKRFSFAETRYINRMIDYGYFKKNRSRITKLFIEPNNPLSIYKGGSGIISVEDSLSYIASVSVSDTKNNIRKITIPITGGSESNANPQLQESFEHYAESSKEFKYENSFMNFRIPKGALYEATPLKIETLGNQKIKIHENTTPLHKYMSISFSLTGVANPKKSYIGRFYKKTPNVAKYVGSKNNGTSITSRTRDFGNFGIFTDLKKPKVKPINFSHNKWISNNKTLRVFIADDETGIKKYKASINGKFALMEYDYKQNLLVYDFNDGISDSGKNDLKLYVEDNVGNNTIFEATFFRK